MPKVNSLRGPKRTEHRRLLEDLSATIKPDGATMDNWCSHYLQTHRSRFLDDLALADRYIPLEAKVLEIGAIPPVMSAALQRTGRRVVGVDIDPSRFRETISAHGLDVRTVNIELDPFPFDNDAFDVAMMNEVFEHLRINPLATMTEIARVIRPGGALLLSTPNLWSYRGIINLFVHRHAWAIGADPVEQYGKLDSLGHMGHVREYTAVEVGRVLEHVGLRPVETLFRPAHTSSWKERALTKLRPNLLPYFTIIARKQDFNSLGGE